MHHVTLTYPIISSKMPDLKIFFLEAILMKINSQKYKKKLKSIFPRDIKNHNY